MVLDQTWKDGTYLNGTSMYNPNLGACLQIVSHLSVKAENRKNKHKDGGPHMRMVETVTNRLVGIVTDIVKH